MNELLIKLSDCIEFGKINMASPYPPQMKGQEGADEITRRALEEGVNPQDILSLGLMLNKDDCKATVEGCEIVCPSPILKGLS